MKKILVCGVLVGLACPAVASSAGADLHVRSEQKDYEPGQRLDWTVDWTKVTEGTSAEDVVVNLDGPHQVVDGSVEAPEGWTVQYSTDGETWSDDASGRVTHLRFSHPSVRGGSQIVDVQIPRPIPPIVTAASGGDGYIPMMAGDRIYAVWHHLPATGSPAASMVCIDTITGTACPGYPKLLGRQSSYNQGQGIYLNRKLYFKNRGATTHGVQCWDTLTEESCGYEPVATLGPVTGTAGGDGGWDQFSSPILYEGRMYFAAHDHRMYCFDPDSGTVCDDYGLAGVARARWGERHVTTRLLNDVVAHDGRVYFSLATAWGDGPLPLSTKVDCFDLKAKAPCTGFGVNGVVSETEGTPYLFLRRNGAGIPTGFCLGVRSGSDDLPAQATTPCYDFDGKNRSPIASAPAFAQFRPYNVEETTIGTRTFFGRYSSLGAYCYDWSTAAPCTGTYFDAAGKSTQTTREHFYGFVARGGCMVGLGHKGIFMSVDPMTGATPCQHLTDTSNVASLKSAFCRDTRYVDGWTKASLAGAAVEDFSRLDVAISDGTDSVVGDMRTGVFDLTALSLGARIKIDVDATVNPGRDPWRTREPRVQMEYTGSRQFCFQTVVEPAPPPSKPNVVVDVVTDEGGTTESVVPDPTPADTGDPDIPASSVPGIDVTSVSLTRGTTALPATGSGSGTAGLLAMAVAVMVAGWLSRRYARRPD